MKKNITINLCGRLFQIDEDAYELLKHYIESLRSAFGRQEGGVEIVDDIETRIAELFDELRQQGVEAITIDHVKDVISRIGQPEELTGEQSADGSQANANNGSNANAGSASESFKTAAHNVYDNVRARTSGKKLYRNPKDKMLAGVLSGFAVYTGTDPIIWRLLMIVFTLFYGSGLLAYIILAIVIPEANTPERILQMEGKDVTPQNLADVVVDKGSQPVGRPSTLRTIFTVLLKLVMAFVIGIMLIVVGSLLLSLLAAILGVAVALLFPIQGGMLFNLDDFGLTDLWMQNPTMLIIFAVASFLVLLLPLYGIIHTLLSWTKRIKPMGVVQRILLIAVWVVAVCTAVPIGCGIAKYYWPEYKKVIQEKINDVDDDDDTIQFKMKQDGDSIAILEVDDHDDD